MISVIVPVYNIEAYISRCIDSILAQTFNKFELILIDDGSSDRSGEICDYYKSLDKRCRVIHQKNLGPGHARNAGLMICNPDYKYITFIDGDDFVHPCYLEMLYNAIISGEYDLAMCKFKYCIKQNFAIEPITSDFTLQDILKEMLFAGNFGKRRYGREELNILPLSVVWGKLYKKEIIVNEKFKRLISEDMEFNTRVYLRIKKTVLVPRFLYYFIRHQDSYSSSPVLGKYYTRLFLIPSFKESLFEIPQNLKMIRGYALNSLYKSILSSRYQLKKGDKLFNKYYRNIVKRTYPEFLMNVHVNLIYKLGISIFLFIPGTYKLFRKIIAKI